MEQSVEKLVKYLPVEQNILKVVEECAELQEVLIKYLTKSEAFKPKMEKISEEMGDVIFRIAVAASALGIEDKVEKRAEYKADAMLTWSVNKFEKKI